MGTFTSASTVIYFLYMVGCVVGLGDSHGLYRASFMLSDYLQFYNHQTVCFLMPDPRDPWTEETILKTYLLSNSYIQVLRPSQLNLNTHYDYTSDSSNINVTYSDRLPCGEGIFVFHVRTQDDAHVFAKVFHTMAPDVRWLILSQAPFISIHLSSIYLPLNNRVTVAAYTDGSYTIPLVLPYQVSSKHKLNIQLSGAWMLTSHSHLQTFGQGISHKSGTFNWEDFKRRLGPSDKVLRRDLRYGYIEMIEGDPILRREDLTGVHLRCTTIQSPPRTILRPKGEKHVDVTGILGSAFKHMMKAANFTSSCKATDDGQWGAQVNDAWTGMIGDIVRGEADIALASLDITEQRSSAVDFLMVIVRTDYRLVMKRPTNDDRKWRTFTSEFDKGVWTVLALTVLILIVALRLATLSIHETTIPISESFTIVLGGLCGQGCSIEFQALSSRVVFLTMMILQVLIMAHYTSQLVSAMAVGPPLPQISTISDVKRHPELKMGFIRGSSVTEYFKTSQNADHQEIFRTMNDENLVGSREEGMKRVLNQPFVFLAAGHYLIKKYGRDCRYFILPTPNFQSMSAFAIKKGSPYIPVLNKIILQMKATGLMKKWHNEWSPAPASCSNLEFSPVEFSIVITPILLLGFGMACATLCLLSEKLVWGARRREFPPKIKSGMYSGKYKQENHKPS